MPMPHQYESHSRKILGYIDLHGSITRQVAQDLLGISDSATKRIFRIMKGKNLVEMRMLNAKNGHYYVRVGTPAIDTDTSSDDISEILATRPVLYDSVKSGTHEWIATNMKMQEITECIKPWRVQIDGAFAVMPDPHAPWPDSEGMDVLRNYLDIFQVETLIIPGDAFDCHALSSFHDAFKIPLDFTGESEADRQFISWLFWQTPIKKVLICAGNHEERIISRTLGRLGVDEVMRLCIGDELLRLKQVEYSKLNNIIVNDKWMFIHPKKGRKVPLSNARDLSQKYPDYNVVVAHQHTVAQGRGPSGKRHWVDIGCMTDPSRHAYTLDANTFNSHQRSFMIVEGDKFIHIDDASMLWTTGDN